MTPEFHLRAKELEAKATKGPWSINKRGGTWRVYSVPLGKGWLNGKEVEVPEYGTVAWPNHNGIETMGCALGIMPDAEFIAESRTLIPKYIQLVELMGREIEIMKEITLYVSARLGSDHVLNTQIQNALSQAAAIEKEIGEI